MQASDCCYFVELGQAQSYKCLYMVKQVMMVKVFEKVCHCGSPVAFIFHTFFLLHIGIVDKCPRIFHFHFSFQVVMAID